MRQAIYDLARYKLQEQFTYADAKNTRRTQALENAIRGVEEFSKHHVGIPAAPPLPETTVPVPYRSPPAPLHPTGSRAVAFRCRYKSRSLHGGKNSLAASTTSAGGYRHSRGSVGSLPTKAVPEDFD